MLIRSSAILVLILTSVFIITPPLSSFGSVHQSVQTNANTASVSAGDPKASPTAFNYSYSQANLYTNASASTNFVPSSFPLSNRTYTPLVWLSTVNRTSNNIPIPATGFRFNVTHANLVAAKLEVNWTLIIPQFNCRGCNGVSVNFNFFGSLTKGTNATYALLNSTNPPITSGTFSPTASLSCPENFCLNATAYIGFRLTLMFTFGWNGTNVSGMHADVGEIVVASIGSAQTSSNNTMQLDNVSNQVTHTTTLSNIVYNDTLRTILHPGGSTLQKWWNMSIINIFYPGGYNIVGITINSTLLYPVSPSVPLENDHCYVGSVNCSQSLISLNVTDFVPVSRNSTITITSHTPNSVSPLTALSGGAPSQYFTPGDLIGVKIVNNPSISNASTTLKTGQLNITFIDPTRTRQVLAGPTTPLQTISGGTFLYTMPPDCGVSNRLCGSWTIITTFLSGFDLGNRSISFNLDQIQISSFSSGGSNNGLTAQGTLAYVSSSLPANATSGIVFAIDAGTPANTPVSTTNSSTGAGLYVSNATLVNGVFALGQQLIMTFTLTNPTNSAYNASVTLVHEWPGSQPHGVNVNFTLGIADGLGDLPFTSGPQSYQAAITLTTNGTQIVLTSLSTRNSKTISMSVGSSPVSPTRQHTGLFKIIVVTKTGTSTISTNTLESPPYAYLFNLPLSPSRYLAYSTPFTTVSGGTFSITPIQSDSILGAKRLVVFALARDANGIVLANNPQNPGFSDSTVLISSMDPLGQVVQGQTVTATLHLKSNSSKITGTLIIDLNLQGTGKVAEKSGVTLTPGSTQDVTLSFMAPSTHGQYALSFSSPQYAGGPLTSQTLQVTILQSNLQILIPAAIGIVAAIIILGIYLLRRQPEREEPAEKTKSAASKPKPTGSANPPSKSLT